jgi:hypothetical protein
MTNRRNSSELISPDAVYDSAIGSAVLVVGGQLPDAVFVELGDQAVIARKRNDEHFAHGVILQAMGLAVDSRQTEIRSGGADGKRGRTAFIGKDRDGVQE